MKRPVTGLELLGRLATLHFDVDVITLRAGMLPFGVRATLANQQGHIEPKAADSFEVTSRRDFSEAQLRRMPAALVIRDMTAVLADVLAGAVDGLSETPEPVDYKAMFEGRLTAQQARVGVMKALTAVRAGLGEILLTTRDANVTARVEKMLEILSPNLGCLRCGKVLTTTEPVTFVNNHRPYLGGMHLRCAQEPTPPPPKGTPP